jgi:hypothetical protein
MSEQLEILKTHRKHRVVLRQLLEKSEEGRRQLRIKIKRIEKRRQEQEKKPEKKKDDNTIAAMRKYNDEVKRIVRRSSQKKRYIWLKYCIVETPGYIISRAECFNNYVKFAGNLVLRKKDFFEELEKKCGTPYRSNGIVSFKGWSIVSYDDSLVPYPLLPNIAVPTPIDYGVWKELCPLLEPNTTISCIA